MNIKINECNACNDNIVKNYLSDLFLNSSTILENNYKTAKVLNKLNVLKYLCDDPIYLFNTNDIFVAAYYMQVFKYICKINKHNYDYIIFLPKKSKSDQNQDVLDINLFDINNNLFYFFDYGGYITVTDNDVYVNKINYNIHIYENDLELLLTREHVFDTTLWKYYFTNLSIVVADKDKIFFVDKNQFVHTDEFTHMFDNTINNINHSRYAHVFDYIYKHPDDDIPFTTPVAFDTFNKIYSVVKSINGYNPNIYTIDNIISRNSYSFIVSEKINNAELRITVPSNKDLCTCSIIVEYFDRSDIDPFVFTKDNIEFARNETKRITDEYERNGQKI